MTHVHDIISFIELSFNSSKMLLHISINQTKWIFALCTKHTVAHFTAQLRQYRGSDTVCKMTVYEGLVEGLYLLTSDTILTGNKTLQ